MQSPITPFQSRVYAKLREVPRGKVTTYRDLAYALGCGSPRAVGQALRRNPDAPHTPCHRVVASDGSIGGFSGMRSGPEIAKKVRRLAAEGVRVREGSVVDFDWRRFVWT